MSAATTAGDQSGKKPGLNVGEEGMAQPGSGPAWRMGSGGAASTDSRRPRVSCPDRREPDPSVLVEPTPPGGTAGAGGSIGASVPVAAEPTDAGPPNDAGHAAAADRAVVRTEARRSAWVFGSSNVTGGGSAGLRRTKAGVVDGRQTLWGEVWEVGGDRGKTLDSTGSAPSPCSGRDAIVTTRSTSGDRSKDPDGRALSLRRETTTTLSEARR
jgi:hypothetical protein